MFIPHYEQTAKRPRPAPAPEHAPPRQIINGKLRLPCRPLKRFMCTNGRYWPPVATRQRIPGQNEASDGLFVAALAATLIQRLSAGSGRVGLGHWMLGAETDRESVPQIDGPDQNGEIDDLLLGEKRLERLVRRGGGVGFRNPGDGFGP